MSQVVNTQTVTSKTTPQVVLLENPAREEFFIENNSTAILYILYGPGVVSSTNHTVSIVGSATNPLNTPQKDLGITGGFRGQISLVWASANGSAQVTEVIRDDSTDKPVGQPFR